MVSSDSSLSLFSLYLLFNVGSLWEISGGSPGSFLLAGALQVSTDLNVGLKHGFKMTEVVSVGCELWGAVGQICLPGKIGVCHTYPAATAGADVLACI